MGRVCGDTDVVTQILNLQKGENNLKETVAQLRTRLTPLNTRYNYVTIYTSWWSVS